MMAVVLLAIIAFLYIILKVTDRLLFGKDNEHIIPDVYYCEYPRNKERFPSP